MACYSVAKRLVRVITRLVTRSESRELEKETPASTHAAIPAHCRALRDCLGCSDSTSPNLSITVGTSAGTIRSGDPLTVTVTVLNLGSKSYTIHANGCPVPFKIFDSEGNIARLDQICTTELKLAELMPGDSYTFTSTWRGQRQVLVDGSYVETPLTTGNYTIRGEITSSDRGVITGGTANVYVLPPQP
jgi:hypothetical protein